MSSTARRRPRWVVLATVAATALVGASPPSSAAQADGDSAIGDLVKNFLRENEPGALGAIDRAPDGSPQVAADLREVLELVPSNVYDNYTGEPAGNESTEDLEIDFKLTFRLDFGMGAGPKTAPQYVRFGIDEEAIGGRIRDLFTANLNQPGGGDPIGDLLDALIASSETANGAGIPAEGGPLQLELPPQTLAGNVPQDVLDELRRITGDIVVPPRADVLMDTVLPAFDGGPFACGPNNGHAVLCGPNDPGGAQFLDGFTFAAFQSGRPLGGFGPQYRHENVWSFLDPTGPTYRTDEFADFFNGTNRAFVAEPDNQFRALTFDGQRWVTTDTQSRAIVGDNGLFGVIVPLPEGAFTMSRGSNFKTPQNGSGPGSVFSSSTAPPDSDGNDIPVLDDPFLPFLGQSDAPDLGKALAVLLGDVPSQAALDQGDGGGDGLPGWPLLGGGAALAAGGGALYAHGRCRRRKLEVDIPAGGF